MLCGPRAIAEESASAKTRVHATGRLLPPTSSDITCPALTVPRRDEFGAAAALMARTMANLSVGDIRRACGCASVTAAEAARLLYGATRRPPAITAHRSIAPGAPMDTTGTGGRVHFSPDTLYSRPSALIIESIGARSISQCRRKPVRLGASENNYRLSG